MHVLLHKIIIQKVTVFLEPVRFTWQAHGYDQVQHLQEIGQDLTEKTEQGSEQEIASNRLNAEKSDDEYKAVKRVRYDNSTNGPTDYTVNSNCISFDNKYVWYFCVLSAKNSTTTTKPK